MLGGDLPGDLAVLVVEDQDSGRRAMEHRLAGVPGGARSARRPTVVLADRASAALEAVQARDFDLFVVDIGLPDQDGIELVRALRARGQPGAVLVYSSRSDGTAFREALYAGADHVAMLEDVLLDERVIERTLELASLRRARNALQVQIAEVERQVAQRRGALISAGVPYPIGKDDVKPIDEVMRSYLLEAIRVIGPNPRELAARLQVSNKVLRRHLDKLGIDSTALFRIRKR
jgi:DNA-binding NtrC family response regulator